MAFLQAQCLHVLVGRMLDGSKRSVFLESGPRACPAESKSYANRKCLASIPTVPGATLGVLVDGI